MREALLSQQQADVFTWNHCREDAYNDLNQKSAHTLSQIREIRENTLVYKCQHELVSESLVDAKTCSLYAESHTDCRQKTQQNYFLRLRLFDVLVTSFDPPSEFIKENSVVYMFSSTCRGCGYNFRGSTLQLLLLVTNQPFYASISLRLTVDRPDCPW